MTQPDDQEKSVGDSSFHHLMETAKNGDENAVGILIDRYRNYLLLIANDDVGQDMKAKIGASDAVQETIMHAQINFAQFQGASESEFKSWLKAILGNDIRQNRRRFSAQKRDAHREVSAQEQSAVARGLADEHLTPSSDAMQREKQKAIAQALANLPEDQQNVIQLRNFDQKSFEEIGDLTGRSADAARKFWARSIESLKSNLNQLVPGWVQSEFGNVDDD